LFMPKKIARFFPQCAAAFFGVAFNMLTFFKGLSLTSHLGIRDYGDHPMIVLILSAIILKNACANAWSRVLS
jgi:hypothetical protein